MTTHSSRLTEGDAGVEELRVGKGREGVGLWEWCTRTGASGSGGLGLRVGTGQVGGAVKLVAEAGGSEAGGYKAAYHAEGVGRVVVKGGHEDDSAMGERLRCIRIHAANVKVVALA